ncbi:MAG: branched-chain amino acid transaminase [Firmicutes bacterium]|jgi:branched-chain amino acid aminotransferase|nr:branched-chain amino acid transaminase [Bacillota bacterium]
MSGTPTAFFEGKMVPLADAKLSIMTHAFLYGTACFEGIRGYWSDEEQQLFIFRLREHYERLSNSCRITRIGLKHSVDELCSITLEMCRQCGHKEDIYIRPVAYKSGRGVGVKLTGIPDDFLVFAVPFGLYVDVSKGLKVCVSSWTHVEDNAIPMRAKINGAYMNAALAKSEALDDGYDEAIFLSRDGHVSEGSAENLFIVRNGKLITPSVTEHILEGITRATLMELATNELGIGVVERRIDRSELYVADECFICGTGAQVAPITEVDHRPVGDGKVGPITSKLQQLYFDVVRGKVDKYRKWCAPVY